MTNIYFRVVSKAAELAGSKAVTMRGMANAIYKHPATLHRAVEIIDRWSRKPYNPVLDRLFVGSVIELRNDTKYGYRFDSKPDHDAQVLSRNKLGNCGKRSNYGDGKACVYGGPIQCRLETIRYGGKWRDGSFAYRDYQSCVGVSRSGKSAVVIVSCILKRRIIAPKDLRFDRDTKGIFIWRVTDKMDFHPAPEDWMRKDFWTHVRKQLASNYTKRMNNRKFERENERIQSIMDTQLMSCYVTLDDSRRAGNCVEGSLSFAERRLGLTREEILAAPFITKVSAKRLLDTNEPRARAAVIQAWKRETMVSI